MLLKRNCARSPKFIIANYLPHLFSGGGLRERVRVHRVPSAVQYGDVQQHGRDHHPAVPHAGHEGDGVRRVRAARQEQTHDGRSGTVAIELVIGYQ